MPQTIRARLTAALIGLAIIPLLTVGLVFAMMSYSGLRQQALATQQLHAQRIGTAVESFIHELSSQLTLLGRMYDVFPPPSAQEQKWLLDELLSFENRFQELSLLDENGKEVLRRNRETIVLAKDLQNRANDTAFQYPISSNQNYYGPVHVHPDSGEPLMAIAVPLQSPITGKTVGVFLGQARLKKIWELLASLPSREGETVFIVDENGTVVAHPDPSVALRGEHFPLPASLSGFTLGLENGMVALSAERVELGSHPLYVVAQRPESEVMALARNTLAVIFMLLLAALATAAYLSFLVVGRITRPLHELTVIAKEIQDGDLSRRAEYTRNDEVGKLAMAFNAMINRVHQSMEEVFRENQERKQAEAALKNAQHMAKLGSWHLDLRTNTLSWSDEIYNLFERDPTTFPATYESFLSVIHPEDRALVDHAYRESVTKHTAYNIEHRLLMPDGRIKNVHERAETTYDETGTPIQSTGTVQDITERTQAEDALRQNRATLRQILDTIPQSIFWKDQEGVYLGCNRVFANATGLDDPELILGKTDFDMPWPKAEAEAYRADDHEVVTTNQSKLHIIEPLQQADGSRLWIDTTKVPLKDSNGTVYGVLGVYADITEKRKADEERQALEMQLRQAQKMEAIGTLAGGIAHDFNNILSIIFGFTELAMMEEDPEKRQDNLGEVHKAAERARDLVRQILTFSRKMEQQRQPLQISLVVKEALKMLRASIPTTIEIRQNIASQAQVLAEPTQIHQVVMNLCTNAYQAMKESGGVLAVSLEEVEIEEGDYEYAGLTAGRYLKLDVGDTGSGIDPAIREKIFEPYFTTKGLGEGTGMGLAVVHGIVKSHHGHITLYSEAGKGTNFHVYLPVTEQNTAATSATPLPAPTGAGERILFVDDEKQICAVANYILTKNGYQVTCFTDPEEALRTFTQQPDLFDLVMTDMTMPHLTGAELAQQLMATKPGLAIILCTGQSALIDREKALAMGIRDYLTKPIPNHTLLTAIHRALRPR